MNKEFQLNGYKLKNPCLDCERERTLFAYVKNDDFCFEHEWNNPQKLKEEKEEIVKCQKKEKIIGIAVISVYFLAFITMTAIAFATTWLYLIAAFIYLSAAIFWSWIFIEEKKGSDKELKEVQDKLNQWVKL